MARLESTALGGYYPAPSPVVTRIARLLKASGPEGSYNYLDPCAGKGEAVLDVLTSIHDLRLKSHRLNVDLYSIELESSRHQDLKSNISGRINSWHSTEACLRGDAFRATWKMSDGASLLWLNPPYDLDPVFGRLEEKFLERFAPTIASKGVLVFLVPFYALKSSAATLAKFFDRIECYRFPEEDFAVYKQVALIATKRTAVLWDPDPILQEKILTWSTDATTIPVIPDEGDPIFTVPSGDTYSKPFTEWKIAPFDLKGLLGCVQPWAATDRTGKAYQIPGIVPEGSMEDLLIRRYPIAMPPRSAHIAAGIAAGIFNGSQIFPDHPESKLPAILVKGVFDKEFRTVDEKLDKDGNVKGVIQIQQPKLVTTALDLSKKQYVTIKPTADITGATSLSDMTMADFLSQYGRGLMEVMLRQCPVLHDPSRPEDQIALPELKRPLFEAQAQAVQAAIKLLGGLGVSKQKRRHRAAFVLGEIGSGKTSVALAVAEALKSKRVLVMCPPHLLTSWQDQIREVVPWFRVVVLSDVCNVQDLAALKDNTPTIAILSRETAKLGHANVSSSGFCAHCGCSVSTEDHAKKRSRCEGRKLVPYGSLGPAVYDLSLDLLRAFPEEYRARQVARTEILQKAYVRWAVQKETEVGYGDKSWGDLIQNGKVLRVLMELTELDTVEALEAITLLLVADPRSEVVFPVVASLYLKTLKLDKPSYGETDDTRKARNLLLMLPPSPKLDAFVAELKKLDPVRETNSYYNTAPWESWQKKYNSLWLEEKDFYDYTSSHIKREGEALVWGKFVVGDRKNILDGFLKVAHLGLQWGPVCGEPLFQAVPEPRRYPLATFIARKFPQLFDLFVADECHEYATDGSAQERAAHRIMSLGVPTLLLTGTIMNGYAESLYSNMWAASEDFRREFGREDKTRFVDRYGYRKRLVEDRDKESGKVVSYGSVTDRVERSERVIGNAPGVLPLFLLRYLLTMSVTLHKTDLGIDIPKCQEIVEVITPNAEQLKRFDQLQSDLVTQIQQDRFEPDLTGKLWGAMAEVPSYLDLCTEDTGNTDSGRYEIRYPDSCGGGLVSMAEAFPSDTILPKEAWMLDKVEAALAEGRNVMVFSWHTRLLPRIARLIEKRTGTKCPILIPEKVPTKKRQDWIDREVVAKKRRVLVVNPVAIQTGLNNLVYFADEIWMENPACNPIIYRQGVGRVDRIGQRLQTRIYFPVYAGTSQQDLHSLLLHKVAISMSTDGLDAESALKAAGVGEDVGFSSFAVGRQLYEIIASGRSKVSGVSLSKKEPERRAKHVDLYKLSLEMEQE